MRCKYCGVDESEVKTFNKTLELCEKHYVQYRRHGKCSLSIFDKNEIITHDSYAEIVLYNKKCEEMERVIIDIEDIEKVKNIKWGLKISNNGKKYAGNKTKNATIYLHRLVMGDFDDTLEVDHINSNGLDNRKQNLRICNHQQNQSNMKKFIDNKSDITGVFWDSVNTKWVATLTNNNKAYNLGRFNDKDEAITYRLMAEKLYCKEFAPQKYLFEQYGINKLSLEYIKSKIETEKKIKGVSFFKNDDLWVAYITINNKKYIKYFKQEIDAIRCRLTLEKEILKDKSPQKHLFEKYNI
jgi:hypothetical protein